MKELLIKEKELLLTDLSARLPYHVRVKVWLKDGTTEEGALDLEHNYGDVLRDAFYYKEIVDIKPYLRPMSSMTEEEMKEYHSLIEEQKNIPYFTFCSCVTRYLDSIHVDHRAMKDKDGKWKTMIQLGLALEAPEGMYDNEQNK